MASKHFNVVVAACNNRGIGINGKLPWRLKNEMAFFKRITSETSNSGRQNAVIMGRKTWESIPEKFRPLPNRINVILSRNMQDAPEGVHICRSLEDVLNLVTSEALSEKVQDLFLIGGSSIYTEAFKSPYCHRIYFTKIMADIKCDTFLPEWDSNLYKKIELENVESSVQTENGINYKYEVYEKPQIEILVAFCNNRGISINQGLPWPPLKTDYEYYTSTMNKVNQKGKKNAIIKGRLTWDATAEREKTLPNILNIVISKTLKETPKYVHSVVSTFEEAVELVTTSQLRDEIDHTFILGGSAVYKLAIESPWLSKIHATRILADFEADIFMPEFTQCCRKIRVPNMEQTEYEENGVKYVFEDYEKIY